MTVTDEMLARMAEGVRPAGGDLVKEATLAYFAAQAIAESGWRELYLAHWASAHPAPDPIEEGVLQVGDRVMFVGEQGGRQGPGTVTRIWLDDSHGRPVPRVEYALDEPYRSPFGEGDKLGGVASRGALAHQRDWPKTFLGDFSPEYVLSEGEGPRPPDWPSP